MPKAQPKAQSRTLARLKTAEKDVRTRAVRSTAVSTATMAGAAMVPVDKPLTELQKKFIKLVAEGESIPNAMQRAGYNDQPSYGYRILKMPNAQALLQRLQAEYAKAAEVTKKDVMDMLKESYEMAKLMAEPASMVAAAREIGKMCGFYEPKKIDININGGGAQRKLEQMDTTELERLIAEAEEAQRSLEASSDVDLPLLERSDGD